MTLHPAVEHCARRFAAQLAHTEPVTAVQDLAACDGDYADRSCRDLFQIIPDEEDQP